MKTLAIYQQTMHAGGGVLTFVKNFIKHLHNYYQITLYYSSGDINDLKDVSKLCNTRRIYPSIDVITADVIILASAIKSRHVLKAKKVITIIHADYQAGEIPYHHNQYTTHLVAVSNHVKKSFEAYHGHKIDKVIHNLPPVEKQHQKSPNSKLTLISATRISPEKGIKRKIELAHKLNEAGIDFEWNLYGRAIGQDRLIKLFPDNLKFRGYSSNILPKIAQADYLVQLSDTEGNPYCIIEALHQLTPVITTPYPAASELITDGINGHIIDFDLSNWKKILQDKIILSNFEPLSNPKQWVEIIG